MATSSERYSLISHVGLCMLPMYCTPWCKYIFSANNELLFHGMESHLVFYLLLSHNGRKINVWGEHIYTTTCLIPCYGILGMYGSVSVQLFHRNLDLFTQTLLCEQSAKDYFANKDEGQRDLSVCKVLN